MARRGTDIPGGVSVVGCGWGHDGGGPASGAGIGRSSSATLRSFGLRIVSLPIRDGQTPTRAQIDEFLRVVAGSRGTVFLHCGAGVGRTGSVAASYLVATGQASGVRATLRNLSVGPPSLEQIAFTMRLHGDRAEHANVLVVAASRMLDAPRRIWTVLG